MERTPSGGLRVPAALTRTGVLQYRDANGNTWGEYRPPEEVFAPESLASLRGAPVTVLHPREMVTTGTWKRDAVGHVADAVGRDGAFVASELLIQDADAVEKVDAKELRELSPGYTCEVEETPGVSPEGVPYRKVQRAIKYNHVALGPAGFGRSGPDVALRMDGAAVEVRDALADAAIEVRAAAAAPPPTTATERQDAAGDTTTMKTLKVRGREYKLDAAEDVAAAQGAIDEQTKKADADTALLDQMQKQVADLLGQIAQLKAQATAAAASAAPPAGGAEPTEAVLDAKLAERAALLEDARKILGPDADLKGKPAVEIKRAVVAKAMPLLKLDAVSVERLDGMFTAVVATATAATTTTRNDAHDATRRAAEGPDATAATRTDGQTGGSHETRTDGAGDSLADAHKKLQDRLAKAGREPLNAAPQKGA